MAPWSVVLIGPGIELMFLCLSALAMLGIVDVAVYGQQVLSVKIEQLVDGR